MRVKVLRSFLDGRTMVEPGDEIEVTETRARQLMMHRTPLVTMTVGGAMRATRPPSSEAAKGGAVDPTASPPAGGQTGEEKPASSRRPGRPRKTRPLTSGAAERATWR